MKAAVVLSTFILIIVSNSATAIIRRRSQPWLSVLSFACGDSTATCIGVVLDKQWVLTTASCFGRCKIEIPLQLSAYVNIPPAAQKRLASSIRLGSKVNGTLVWQHPEYNRRTFANDLALVKLGCHGHTLEKLNLASNCSAQESQQSSSDGYVYLRNKVIKFDNADKEKAECFSRQGTGTFYYHTSTLRMVTTRSRGSSCMELLICKDTEQLKSFMQGNAPECNNTVPLPADIVPTLISDQELQLINGTSIPPVMSISTSVEISEIQTMVVVPTPLSTKSSISSDTSTSTKALFLPIPTHTSASPVSTNTLTSSHVLKMHPTSEASTATILPTPETSSSTIISTETSTSTQVSVSTSTLISSQVLKMQTTTEAPTATILLTPVATKTSSSIQFSVSTSTPEISKMQTPTEDVLLTPTSTKTSHILSSTVIPSSAVTEVSTSEEVASTSEAITSTSEALTSTSEVVTSTSEAVTSTLEVVTSTTEAVASTSEAVASTQLPTATPTESPTSGCQLSIENGVARSRTVTSGFMLITYMCNTRYRFNGLNNPVTGSLIYACVNGKMTIKPPACERITCPDLDPIGNGTLVIRGSGLGSTATYRCDDGFILSDGFTVRVCTEHGEWTGRAGFCERACPIPKSLLCNNGQRILPSRLTYGRLGDTAGYRVRDGYAVIGEAPVCQSDFTWSAPPKCIKLCNEKQVINNGKVLVNHNATSYTRKIECNEGYKPVGHTEQHCTDNGDWTPYFQRCAKTCGQVTLDNGEVRMFESMNFLVAIMQCNEGFHLEPARGASTCINGEWIPSIPRCIENK